MTNNVWGAPQAETLVSGVYLGEDSRFGWYWSRENPVLNPGNTFVQPIFPSVRVGGGPTVKSNSRHFPVLTSDIRSLRFDVTYSYLLPPTGAYNLAYEMFFSDTSQPSPDFRPKAEVMIWIHATFGQPPSAYRGEFTDGNNTYSLYSWVSRDGRLYASFIMEGDPQFEGRHAVNVKTLMDVLAIDPNWYLLGVELGSEIVDGSGRIEISKFSVNMNGIEL
ncbi:MAG: hypothetical protein HYX90_10255 [Chloroflexi bacterium]|nr:hypothetical protein [Chloroflexota bacterium]